MSLANETELEQKITTYYETHAVGRARSMGTRRALTHLRSIIDRGWAASKKSPPASQATWYRTIGELVDAGISLAALQSFDGTAESRLAAGVVVSLRSVLEVQAVSSAPSWFKPADLSRWLDDQDLMSVPHRHRRAVGDGLVACVGTDDGRPAPEHSGIFGPPSELYETADFLRRSAASELSTHAGIFPPEVDWDLIVVQSEVADLRVPTVPRHPQLRLV